MVNHEIVPKSIDGLRLEQRASAHGKHNKYAKYAKYDKYEKYVPFCPLASFRHHQSRFLLLVHRHGAYGQLCSGAGESRRSYSSPVIAPGTPLSSSKLGLAQLIY